jgi:cytochrome c oxidase cbb3-type subunit 3
MNPDNPNEPRLLEHDADGIQELDNLLPRWWVWLFYLTTIFGIVYFAYYHLFSAGDLQAAEYQKEFRAGEEIKAGALAKFESSLSSIEPATEQVGLAKGQQIYTVSCAPCHRPDGGGLVGPNLTDDYWIHGGSFGETMKVIWNGVPEKGMVTWKGVLKPEDIHLVASYIYTLRGSQPPNPKLPENQQAQPSGPSEFE